MWGMASGLPPAFGAASRGEDQSALPHKLAFEKYAALGWQVPITRGFATRPIAVPGLPLSILRGLFNFVDQDNVNPTFHRDQPQTDLSQRGKYGRFIPLGRLLRRPCQVQIELAC
jgi:hypothetical protein